VKTDAAPVTALDWGLLKEGEKPLAYARGSDRAATMRERWSCAIRKKCVAGAVAILALGAGILVWSLHQNAAAAADIFTDVTASAGIQWKHVNGESEDRTLIEPLGAGVAFVDVDKDGLLDIFLAAGGQTPHGRGSSPPRNALYRNLGNGKFEEVAAKWGIDHVPFYALGVAVADYDNDGFQDLYITGYPSGALFHNNGNGTFTDVTEKAGVKNAGKIAASAVWFDYDRDGRLDLFVANYAKFSYDGPQHCQFEGQPLYCAQTEYPGDVSRLYHNNGDGTFTDVTAQAGLAKLVGRALGVVAIDVDDDGWPDLFVASDATPNQLLLNKHNGTFEEIGLSADVAFNMDGAARAGMGVDACDLSGNGRPDIVHTAFSDEQHAFFVNMGHLSFEERTGPSGIARITQPYVGWGIHCIDYDNDGNQDLMIVNGHINHMIERTRRDLSYREPPLLLGNAGNGTFRNMEKEAGPVFQQKFRARGLAVGDFDNDGRTDAIFTMLNDTPGRAAVAGNAQQPGCDRGKSRAFATAAQTGALDYGGRQPFVFPRQAPDFRIGACGIAGRRERRDSLAVRTDADGERSGGQPVSPDRGAQVIPRIFVQFRCCPDARIIIL